MGDTFIFARYCAKAPTLQLSNETLTKVFEGIGVRGVGVPEPPLGLAHTGQEGSYRIGIFPGGGDFGPHSFTATVEERVARVLQTNIKKSRALVLAYSFYDEMLNAPRIKNPDRLWVGGEVRKKPNLELVYRLARERGVDGVVMYWGVYSSSSWTTGTPNPMWVYLIDVERRQVYQRKGTTAKSSVRKIIKQVFSDFIKGRGVTPETASRTTPYRIAVFPFDATEGSALRTLERLTDTLHGSIKRDPALVLAYSYYDDMLNAPRIKNPDRLWAGNVVRKNPNLELVYQMGRERGIDGVVMCWGVRLDSSYYTQSPYPMWVYLIDIERRAR